MAKVGAEVTGSSAGVEASGRDRNRAGVLGWTTCTVVAGQRVSSNHPQVVPTWTT